MGAPGGSEGPGKPSLFNETWIGQYTWQEDIDIAADEEQEMLHIVSNHRRVLKIDDFQEMMVDIEFAMPFMIQQFQFFLCLHAY
jgi:hypothetical protein